MPPLGVYAGIPADVCTDATALLKEHGLDVVHTASTDPAEIAALAAGARVLLAGELPVTADLLDRLPDVEVVSLCTQGADQVDLAACERRGVQVAHVPPVAAEELAVHAWAMTLALVRGLHAGRITRGPWGDTPPGLTVPRLSELTLGIIGTGASAAQLVRLAGGSVRRVTAYSRSGRSLAGATMAPDLWSLLRASDIISLHAPLTDDTHAMVDAAFLAAMRPGSHLVNIARGGLVDSAALAEALDRGHLRGAALDVLDQEPPPPDHPLLDRDDVLITPHVAWFSSGAEQRYLHAQAANVVAWLTTGRVDNRL